MNYVAIKSYSLDSSELLIQLVETTDLISEFKLTNLKSNFLIICQIRTIWISQNWL